MAKHPKEVEAEQHQKTMAIVKQAQDEIKKPELINNIYKVLEKQHIGNRNQTLLTFVVMCSGILIPDYRVSLATRGNSSIGKSNMTKTCYKHLPDGWFIFGTRFTRATLEDDIADFPILIILEKPQDDTVTQAVKQIAEDGLRIHKKEMDGNKRGKKRESKYIPRKTVIYTSTENETDEELATRFLINNIERDDKRYKLVMEKTLEDAASVDKQIELRKIQNNSWIKEALKDLNLKKYDVIVIPYAVSIELDVIDEKAQRDLKRFLNLIRASAWLHQKQRRTEEKEGFNVLFADKQDINIVMDIAKTAFIESSTGIDKELQDTIDSINRMVLAHGKYGYEIDPFMPIDIKDEQYVDRRIVQEDMKLSHKTIASYMEKLRNEGMIEIHSKGKHQRSFIRTLTSNKSRNWVVGKKVGNQLGIGMEDLQT